MTTYLTVKQKNTCYGCSACEQICPQKAISFAPDEEGFLYPVLDENKCVSCGLCKLSCPYDNEKTDTEPFGVYAAQNKNKEELLRSSSGGMFSVFAQEALSKGGVVVGCAFTEDLKAEHTVAFDKSGVDKMHGSKYVQSNMGDVYSQVKAILEDGKNVFFTGTPCQVDGLKRYLRKPYDNLLTVDLVCHGVPSPALLEEYISSTEKVNGQLQGLQFRNKARNGWRSEGTLTFKNGKEKSFSPFRDSYYNLYYMKNCVSRISCYSCKYASPSRVGDVTIGDFWNASDFLEEKAYKNGISVLLVNTQKGKRVFEDIRDKLFIYETDIQTAQKGNGRLVKGGEIPQNRSSFYKKVKENGYEETVKQECKYTYLVPFIKRHIPQCLKKFVKKFLG